MTTYAEQIEQRLGGLTRRQALAATPKEVMFKYLEKRAQEEPHSITWYSTEKKVEHLQTFVKLGLHATSRLTGVSNKSLTRWADIVLTQDRIRDLAPSKSYIKCVPTNSKLSDEELYPYLHLLADVQSNDPRYTFEFKRRVVTYRRSLQKTADAFGIKASVVQTWRNLASRGRYHGTPALDTPRIQQPIQYGLIELSPLAQRVSDLEKENETLKARLAFFEKFKREMQKL